MTWPGSLMHLRSAAELNGSADCLTVALAAVVLLCLSLSSGLVCINAGGISKRKNKSMHILLRPSFGPTHHHFLHINSKRIKELNASQDTVRLLEENTRTLVNINCSNIFLDLPPRIIKMKTKQTNKQKTDGT